MVNRKTYLPQWLCLLALFLTPAVQAASREIRALFTPDPNNPQSDKFVNKSPSSGYCAAHADQCEDHNIFSFRLPVRFNSVRVMQPNASPRNSAMFKLPSGWSGLNVTNTQTGETQRLEVRIAGVVIVIWDSEI